MKAGWRLGRGFAIALALATAPVALPAQTEEPPPEDSGVVGPRELENFSINGTVTQPAPERPAPTPPVSRPPAQGPASATPARDRPTPSRQEAPAGAQSADNASSTDRRATAADARAPIAARPDSRVGQGSSVTVALPPIGDSATSGNAQPTFEPSAAPGDGPSLLPWLLAAFALALGALFFWWQKRAQPAYASGPEVHAFAAPEPAPRPARPRAPAAAPAPVPTAPQPAPDPFAGLVSTRLRPWVDLAFEPARCSVEDDKVIIDFEIEMLNRGNAPARAVLVEARMVNAGPSQDAEIGQFFSNPVGQGERIDTIDPLKKVRIKSRIVAPRDQVQIYDVGGRKVFVPLVAFNVLYSWSRGMGQTSLGFLVGRDTKSAKMAPFRLDMGPRLFRGLGKQPLPLEVRQ